VRQWQQHALVVQRVLKILAKPLIYSLGKINLLVLIFNHPSGSISSRYGRSDANPVSNFVSYCSPKDHNEFGIVRENVKKHLEVSSNSVYICEVYCSFVTGRILTAFL